MKKSEVLDLSQNIPKLADDFYSNCNHEWLCQIQSTKSTKSTESDQTNQPNQPTKSHIQPFDHITKLIDNLIIQKLDILITQPDPTDTTEPKLKILWEQTTNANLIETNQSDNIFYETYIDLINTIVLSSDIFNVLIELLKVNINVFFKIKMVSPKHCRIIRNFSSIITNGKLEKVKTILQNFEQSQDKINEIIKDIIGLEIRLLDKTDEKILEKKQLLIESNVTMIISSILKNKNLIQADSDCSVTFFGKKYFNELDLILSDPDNLLTLKYYLIIKLITSCRFKIPTKRNVLRLCKTIFRSDISGIVSDIFKSTEQNIMTNLSEKKDNILELFNKIINYSEIFFNSVGWIDEIDKIKLFDTLKSIKLEFDYPNQFSLDDLNITDQNDLISNIINVRKFCFEESLNIDSLYNRNFVDQTMRSAYAYHNTKIIGISLFFLVDELIGNSIENLIGTIGIVIAHEIGHFIDRHMRINKNKFFIDQTNKLKNQYDSYTQYNTRFSGIKYLKENIAEYLGWFLAIGTFKHFYNSDKSDRNKLDIIFRSYAKFRCEYASEIRTIFDITDVTNPYPIGKFRINGIVSNLEDFYNVYQIKPNDLMFICQSDRVDLVGDNVIRNN